MHQDINRRTFVKDTPLTSAGLALALDAGAQDQAKPAAAPAATDTLPKGKIDKLEISRLILGGNLLTHYTHSRDLKHACAAIARNQQRERSWKC